MGKNLAAQGRRRFGRQIRNLANFLWGDLLILAGLGWLQIESYFFRPLLSRVPLWECALFCMIARSSLIWGLTCVGWVVVLRELSSSLPCGELAATLPLWAVCIYVVRPHLSWDRPHSWAVLCGGGVFYLDLVRLLYAYAEGMEWPAGAVARLAVRSALGAILGAGGFQIWASRARPELRGGEGW